jgi:murein L,D-transpeptidase YafK
MRPIRLFVSMLLVLAGSAAANAMSILPTGITRAPTTPTHSEKLQYKALFADKVIVKKSRRRLYLLKGDRPFRSYRVALGFAPKGDKQQQGDGRTPEGRYLLDWRSSNSKYRKALHVSYPNHADRLRARRKGKDPGGMIMIHGQPTVGDRDLQQVVSQEDWTHGCIAVSNMAIDEIWRYTSDGTPIEILP